MVVGARRASPARDKECPKAGARPGPYLVIEGRASVPLEDHLAVLAAEYDLKRQAADRVGVAAADRTGGGRLHVGVGQRQDLDLQPAPLLGHQPDPWISSSSGPSKSRSSLCSSMTSSALIGPGAGLASTAH